MCKPVKENCQNKKKEKEQTVSEREERASKTPKLNESVENYGEKERR